MYKIEGCVDNDKNNKYSRCFEGYCIDLLNKIQEELKFNFTIRNVSEYGYMHEDEPHEWSGMVRELKDRVSASGETSTEHVKVQAVDIT